MIGKLRHRLTIEEPIATPDTGGGKAIVWQALARSPVIWARIEPLSARITPVFGQNSHEATHKITLRFRDDLSPDMRLRKDTRLFTIRSILPIKEDGGFLTLLTREITP